MLPKRLQLQKGKSGIFKCLTKYALDSISWRFLGNDLPKNTFIVNHNVLYINHVTDENAGYYECEGQVNVNGNFVSSSSVKVYGKSMETMLYVHV